MQLRYERKYLIPYRLLDKMRARISSFVLEDKYCLPTEHNYKQYTVRSIYLDSPHMDCHEEKTEGVELRKKFRIRTYNHFDPNSVAILEIKRKIQNRIKKHKAITFVDRVEPLMFSSDIFKYLKNNSSVEEIEDAQRFFFHVKKRNLRPSVLVTYEREAYFGKLDQGVRITFDKNIRSYIYPKFNDLFREDNLKHLFPAHFILEIKYYTDEMPTWAKSLVQEFKLRNDALSKYTIGYDVHTKRHIFNY
jgi:SPX domain protein involved in polyphosphate accumulation